jgi:4-hydroxybenzoate polyprenyltransferase
MNLLKFFVFGNGLIALAAVLMSWQTMYLFSHRVDGVYLWFVFFSTLCSYGLHWYLTPWSGGQLPKDIGWNRGAWNERNRWLVLVLFVLGSVGGAVCFWMLRTFYLYIIPIGLLTFLYSAPKIPVKPFVWLRPFAVAKTLYLSLAWVYVTTVLAWVVGSGSVVGCGDDRGSILYILYRFFLMFALCLLFDLRDSRSDRLLGIRNITTLYQPRVTKWVFWLSVGLCSVFGTLLSAVFGYWLVFVLLSPLVLLCVVYQKAQVQPSDWLYYGVLDGLLLFSPLTMIIIAC